MDRYADMLQYVLPIAAAGMGALGQRGRGIAGGLLGGIGVANQLRRNQILDQENQRAIQDRATWQGSLQPGGSLVSPRYKDLQISMPEGEEPPIVNANFEAEQAARKSLLPDAPIVDERYGDILRALPPSAGMNLLAQREQERAPKYIGGKETGYYRVGDTGPAERVIEPAGQGFQIPRTGDQVFVEAARAKFPDSPESQAGYIRELRNNPVGWQNQVFNDLVTANSGDKGQAAQQLIDMQTGKAGQTAAASERARLGVRSSPQYQQTERDIARERAEGRTEGTPLEAATQRDIAGIEGALRQVGNIRANLDDQFLGPVRGTDMAFSTRRSIGNYINAPLGSKEVVFRQSIADVSDQLLRARSGAQINEQEYQRLRGMLPKATDEPQVFRAGLQRFENELNNTIQSKRTLGTTPRGSSGGGGGAAPRGIPKVLSIEKIAD